MAKFSGALMMLDEGEPISVRGDEPRVWLKIGRPGGDINIMFDGADKPLAKKLADVVAAHRAEVEAARIAKEGDDRPRCRLCMDSKQVDSGHPDGRYMEDCPACTASAVKREDAA
tara:strand:+ start:122 stop:466 length:345 start_codon:yes stop_codon:yes gene_type:complete